MAHLFRQPQKQATNIRIGDIEDCRQSPVGLFQVALEPRAHLFRTHAADERALGATAVTAGL
jgi:hypothetical protein